MGHKLITQVILIATSIAILLTYVKPAFGEIAIIQDDIIRYENTIVKAEELNNALRSLITAEQNISNSEKQKLNTYLPTEIDEVVIMRDMQNIFEGTSVVVTGLSAQAAEASLMSLAGFVEGSGVEREDEAAQPVLLYRDFQVSFNGTYEELKNLLARLEANAYPLEVVTLTFSSSGEGADEPTRGPQQAADLPSDAMSYNLVVRAFALPGSDN